MPFCVQPQPSLQQYSSEPVTLQENMALPRACSRHFVSEHIRARIGHFVYGQDKNLDMRLIAMLDLYMFPGRTGRLHRHCQSSRDRSRDRLDCYSSTQNRIAMGCRLHQHLICRRLGSSK